MTLEDAIARNLGLNDYVCCSDCALREVVPDIYDAIRQWLSGQGGDLLEPTDDGWRAVKAEVVESPNCPLCMFVLPTKVTLTRLEDPM